MLDPVLSHCREMEVFSLDTKIMLNALPPICLFQKGRKQTNTQTNKRTKVVLPKG